VFGIVPAAVVFVCPVLHRHLPRLPVVCVFAELIGVDRAHRPPMQSIEPTSKGQKPEYTHPAKSKRDPSHRGSARGQIRSPQSRARLFSTPSDGGGGGGGVGRTRPPARICCRRPPTTPHLSASGTASGRLILVSVEGNEEGG